MHREMNAWWFQYFTTSLLIALFIGRISYTYYKNKDGGLGEETKSKSWKFCFIILFLLYEVIEVFKDFAYIWSFPHKNNASVTALIVAMLINMILFLWICNEA